MKNLQRNERIERDALGAIGRLGRIGQRGRSACRSGDGGSTRKLHAGRTLSEANWRFAKRAALEFISAATGGPYWYAGKRIREIHAGMGIGDGEFDVILLDFRRALEECGVSANMAQQVVAMVSATRSEIVENC